MKWKYLRRVAVAVALSSAFLFQETWALAGTTGGVVGTVTDQSGKVVAGAKVTATAPSETVSTTTDSAGRFAFLSLSPDTYTIQVQKSGYANQSVIGIVVFADNNQTLAIKLPPQLQTIASVTARASSIVKAGTTTDVYSVNSAVAGTAQALGGGGSLNQAYSALAAVPGVFIPQGQNGWAQSVFVRGSNYTQLGYEYDGVPIQRAFDQYPASQLSSLGQQELQVYAGSAPTDSQSSAIGGFINQVIKTGTFPGFGNGNLGYGTPSFYRKLSAEAGGATPDRKFSWYVGVGGYNQSFRYYDQYDGQVLDPAFGSTYNLVAQNCAGVAATAGCYKNTAGFFNAFPTAPSGFATGPTFYGGGAPETIFDRDIVANFHFAIAHPHDGGRDDVQLLYSNSYLKTQYDTSFNGWLYATDNVANGTANYLGSNYPTCGSSGYSGSPCAVIGPKPYIYYDTTTFTGPVGAQLTSGLLGAVSPYLQPQSPSNRQLSSPIGPTQTLTDPNNTDFADNNFGVVKLQYQHNMGSTAFVRLYGYTSYSDWLNTSLSGATLNANFVGAVPEDYELIAHTRGVALTFVDQLTPQHLLNFTGGYTEATTVRWNNQWFAQNVAPTQVAVAVNSANPTNGTCYAIANGAATPTYCGGTVSGYSNPVAGAPTQLTPTNLPAGVNPSNVGSVTCGSGPCEFYTVQNGNSGPYNTVEPQFSNLSLNDTWRPNDKITFDAGIHYDNFGYVLGNGTIAPSFESNGGNARLLWQNSANNWLCFNSLTQAYTAATAASATQTTGSCAPGSSLVRWSNASASTNAYQEWEPRFGLTYELNPLNVVRVAYGKFAQPASSAFQQYLDAGYNLFTGPALSYYPLGYTNPGHLVYPEISYNLDASWEHQSKGSDFSFKISPFYRKTNNEIFTVLLDPKTNFSGGVNVGSKSVSGAELLLTKGDFNRNGLSAQLSYTYTYGTVKFSTLPSGNTVVGGVNSSILQYNAYTSFCANNPSSSKCSTNGTAVLPTNGKTAAPCYAAVTGAPDPSCSAPGDIANPYWNAPAQPLFNASDSFIAYNQLPGTTPGDQGTQVGSSYIIPHVVSFLLSYKHDKLRVSPTIQFSGGGKYGDPVAGLGIDPAAGCALSGAPGVVPGSKAGPIAPGADPRYPYGAPGGQPYLAQSCTSALIAPDAFTGQFDNFGVFTEPDNLTANLQVDYDVTPRVTLSVVTTNLLDSCFGGTQVPWGQGSRIGCWYTPLNYVGNFYNPGSPFQGTNGYPYGPSFGTVFQSVYGAQSNPINLFVTAKIKL